MRGAVLAALGWRKLDHFVVMDTPPGFSDVGDLDVLDSVPLDSIPLVLAAGDHMRGSGFYIPKEVVLPYLSKRLELGA